MDQSQSLLLTHIVTLTLSEEGAGKLAGET